MKRKNAGEVSSLIMALILLIFGLVIPKPKPTKPAPIASEAAHSIELWESGERVGRWKTDRVTWLAGNVLRFKEHETGKTITISGTIIDREL